MASKTILLFYLIVSSCLVCKACSPNEYPLPYPSSGCIPYQGAGGRCVADSSLLGLLSIILGGKLASILEQLGLCHPTLYCVGGYCRLLNL